MGSGCRVGQGIHLVESKFGGRVGWGRWTESLIQSTRASLQSTCCVHRRPPSGQGVHLGDESPLPCEVHLLVWEDLKQENTEVQEKMRMVERKGRSRNVLYMEGEEEAS